ncbi:solute carrier family 25 member 39-like isoform X2 [Pteropus alecto]|uniref:solute carrier family 25 member 39-like isoform X2 n=1 Tax=Pteropus alecto TaxID=9402 RepID=UPI0003F0FDF0|nr:solute carrier family 25 member 39-like isoform X2 [Pteropus alecto]
MMADQDPGGISPLQQMVASGAGAVVTSLFMTPLDVVKVRLQSQRPSVTHELMPPSRLWSLSYAKWKCLLYCNGVLEPMYLCPNGARCATWFQDPTRFTGTMVRSSCALNWVCRHSPGIHISQAADPGKNR